MGIEVQEVIPALPIVETAVKQQQSYIEVPSNTGVFNKAFIETMSGEISDGALWLAFWIIIFFIFLKPIIWLGKWAIILFVILWGIKVYTNV